MEIMIPVSNQVRNANLRREWKKAQANLKPVDGEEHFKQMGALGKMLWELYQGEAHKRSKAFSNPSFIRFMSKYFDFVEKRAKEMGYRYEDVMISGDSGITKDGLLVLRVEPKSGAERIHAS